MTLEVDEHDFELIAAGEAVEIIEPVVSVEIKQQGGLLSQSKRALSVVGYVGGVTRNLLGIRAESGPTISVILAQEKEV